MSRQTIKVKNSGGFWGFAKWLIILIVAVMGISLIGNLISSVKSFFAPEKIDAKAETQKVFNDSVNNGDIILITDPQKEVIKNNMNDDTAIKLEDIITNMSVYDYQDIVVFVKNRDTKPFNVVFRKTDNGLVLDGMLLQYGKDWGKVLVKYYEKKSNSYGNYSYSKFDDLNAFTSPDFINSCFSFNDAIGKTIMYNQPALELQVVRIFFTAFRANYKLDFIKVTNQVMSTIYKEFTSFNEKQHIMFDSLDEFSAFYSDVYQSIANLKKDCLVDYTNSEYVGLYEGVPGTDTCKYYKGNSKFVVDYNKINTRAYSVDSGNYANGHVFDTDYSVIAYPKITFNLIHDKENTNLSDSDLSAHLKNNPLNVQSVLTNTVTQETKTFSYDKNNNQYYAYLDYVTYQVDLTTEDEILQFDIQSFTFDVNTTISTVDIKYSYLKSLAPDGPGGTEPTKGTFTINYIFDREDINEMLEANSTNIQSDSLIFVSVKGYDSTDSLIHSFDLVVDKYLESTEDSFTIPFARYVVEIYCPILEFTIDETISNQSLTYEFVLSSVNSIEIIELSFKWNGIQSGFTI